MTTYEVLDLVADSYTPLLFLGYLAYSVFYWRSGDRLAWVKGLVGIVIAYFFMFIDGFAHLWESLSMDYSTHSAVALALIIFHVHKRRLQSAPAITLVISLVGYYGLEVYQQYHTVLDIISTAVVVGPAIVAAYWSISEFTHSGPSLRVN